MATNPEALVDAFEKAYGRRPEVVARAPGRVNLIGEHTDYMDGLVLPCAIDRDTAIAAAPRDDRRFRVFSEQQDTGATFAAGDAVEAGHWSAYLAAVVAALREAGVASPGADLAVASDVPPGSGLSSSAALCVAGAAALAGEDATPREWAEWAHRAESGHVGVPCGVMDSFASALGREGHALRIDCRSLAVEPVALSGAFALLVAHSGVTRELAAGAYARRRHECERGRDVIARERGVASLRDCTPADLAAVKDRLEPDVVRRVRHVLTENARVEAFCADLGRGDLAAAGAHLRAGMRSLRDDFEVSVAELDALCEIADAVPGVHGSRLTGAGFGGCTLHLVEAAAAEAARQAIAGGFADRFGRRPPVWRVRPAAGASREPV